MRVSSINSINGVSRLKSVKKHTDSPVITEPRTPNQPQFKGKVGSVAGVIFGGIATVGLAIGAAPVLVCAGPLLGVIGGMAGDKLEEEVNDVFDVNDDDDVKKDS